MGRHLIIVGGGHAHLTTLMRISQLTARGHRVTLVAPDTHHYYSGMGPGMLGGFYKPEEIRFPIKTIAESRGATFLKGYAARVDPEKKMLHLHSGPILPYDVVSFNIGSQVPMEMVSARENKLFPVKPIDNLLRGRRSVLDLIGKGSPDILVVGGGPAGLEISGNLWKLVHDHGGTARITLLAGEKLLGHFPEKARRKAKSSLTSRGIDVVEGKKASRIEDGTAFTEDNRPFSFDACFLAVGVKPPALFRDSNVPVGKDGGLLVNRFLQSTVYPEIFGGGDAIHFEPHPLDKVGVYAVKQNPVLFHNLMAALEGGDLKPFTPQENYLLIFNLGDGKGLLRRGPWVLEGKLAFLLKDYIDRKFMKKFSFLNVGE
jgi:NADH dehydrogenase FAD-containing subunit